ncbi:MAG: hypothetical protein AAB092_09930 [Chloroflexota bacterium]
MTTRVLKTCLGASLLTPLLAVAGLGLAPKTAAAAPPNFACDCTAYCDKAISFCTQIYCGIPGGGQYTIDCYGKYSKT